jgi:protein TonB
MRPIATFPALALATLLAGCAGHAKTVPASAGFSTPGPPPEGKLSPGPETSHATPTRATSAPPPPAAAPAAAPAASAAAAGAAPAAAASAAKPEPVTYVDELPEAITKVPASYPDAARKAGISGTVMVQAYVRTDGSVGDTRIQKSVPGLDEAAAAAVKQWRFKPATLKAQPVEWWVSVPVKFSLH